MYFAKNSVAQLSNYKVSILRPTRLLDAAENWTHFVSKIYSCWIQEYDTPTSTFFQNKEKFLFSCYFPHMDSMTAVKFSKSVNFLGRSCFKSRKVWKWWQKDRISDQLIIDIWKVRQFIVLTKSISQEGWKIKLFREILYYM